MNTSQPDTNYTQAIDGTLAALGSVQPRDGLEQRILTGLESAPALPWYRRYSFAPAGQHRWMLAAASAVIVAGGVTMSAYRNHAAAPVLLPVAVHAPHPAQQAVGAAAGVAMSDHLLQRNTVHTRHRGVRRSHRAAHERVPLPRGTAMPRHPFAPR